MASIRDTLRLLEELATTPPHDEVGCYLDDMAAAEMLLDGCEPRLSAAATQHLMGVFVRRRQGFILSSAVAELGHCAQ